MLSPEDGEQEWNQDDAGAGDEAGLGGRGVQQARRLECVAAEHEEAERCAGQKLFLFEIAQDVRAEHGHERGSEREAEREEDENGGVSKGVFDNDEGSAPKERAED